MNMSARQLKELETKVQDKLYDNIKLLTHIYPTTKEFDTIFKKNMFAKSNKAAFQHIVHYLFHILKPDLVKEKMTWPLYDVKLESIFRNEVVAFINYINSEYEYANIPNLMASHMVSPGGFRFVKFMLKLSMLVIYEHLKKNELSHELLTAIRPHKDPNMTNIIIKKMKTNTGFVERNCEAKWQKFNITYTEALQEAEGVVNNQRQIEKGLYNIKNRFEERKETTNCTKNVNIVTHKCKALKEKMIIMEKIKNLCCNGEQLLTFLSSDKLVLNFKKDAFVLPLSLTYLSKVNSDLDLHHLFKSVSILLENENLEMSVFTVDQLNEMTKLLTDLYEKYLHLDQKLLFQKNELIELCGNFLPEVNGTPKLNKIPFIISTEVDTNSSGM